MLETKNFPQADNIIQVGQVASAISDGHYSDDEIESYIGLYSQGRQGRYYRGAAELLGLITNHNNTARLTPLGKEYAALSKNNEQIDFLSRCLVNIPVFKNCLEYIQEKSPSANQFKQWFLDYYPGSNSTAQRRLSTFLQYFKATHLIEIASGKLLIQNYDGLIATQLDNSLSEALCSSLQNASDLITSEYDSLKLERANYIHSHLVNSKAKQLAQYGFSPKYNAHIDLFSNEDSSILYEMKSINTDGRNFKSQIRKAVSQLYEYRYIYGENHAKLCIVTNQEPSSKNTWLIDYLENDRNISYEWLSDDSVFECRDASKDMLGPYYLGR